MVRDAVCWYSCFCVSDSHIINHICQEPVSSQFPFSWTFPNINILTVWYQVLFTWSCDISILESVFSFYLHPSLPHLGQSVKHMDVAWGDSPVLYLVLHKVGMFWHAQHKMMGYTMESMQLFYLTTQKKTVIPVKTNESAFFS